MSQVLLDSVVYTIGNAYPIRDELQAPVSWAITKALSAAAYEPYAAAARSANLPAIDPSCTASTVSQGAAGQLSLELTGGPLLISVIACTFAIVTFCVSEVRSSKARRSAVQIIETPSFADRTYKMRANARQMLATAERTSPAYHNQDLRLIAKMLNSRHMTQIRMDAHSSVRTDTALTLNDVPMLLRAMRDAMGVTLQAQGSADDADAEKMKRGFSQYLRSSSVMDEDDGEEQDWLPSRDQGNSVKFSA